MPVQNAPHLCPWHWRPVHHMRASVISCQFYLQAIGVHGVLRQWAARECGEAAASVGAVRPTQGSGARSRYTVEGARPGARVERHRTG
eukprot:scaffold7754_cov118-Isochrysis_galbana.AAC.3